jgi:O-methyltransferase
MFRRTAIRPSRAAREKAMSARERKLYLDLLMKTLTNVIYGDPPCSPGHEKFDMRLRSTGHDWPSMAHSMAGLARLENVSTLAQRVIDENIPGDFIEAGVWRGGCCILMRGVLAANAIENRKVYVADSFEGLPPPKPEQFPADRGDILHRFKELAIPVEQVKSNFERYGLLDEKVVFVKGFFEDTLPKLDAGPFALIRLDGDMYSSTIVALESLYPKLSEGGFVIIDDYGAVPACRQAVADFRSRLGIEDRINHIDWTGAWWRKQPANEK